jgi:DNA-binding LacI/PurR family transcriptional regulator
LDDQVTGFLHAFASSHIQVPQDIRLVGYDDIDMAAEMVTVLSTYVNRSDSSGRPLCGS